MLNFWLRNFGFDGGRLRGGRCRAYLGWRANQELVALHLRECPGFQGSGWIRRRLSLDCKPLNGPTRVCVHYIKIRAVVIDHVVLHGDIGHVYRVCDVGDVLHRRKNPIPQHRLADEPHVAEIVIFRADIVHDIDVRADRLSFINNARTPWRQRRPANVIAPGSPRNPGRSPVQVASGEPNPAVVGEIGPATIMIRGPAEILVTNPCPTVICISPVSV